VTDKFPLIVKTSFGFEDILIDELTALGATNIEKLTRAVLFEADTELMYKVNLWSRVTLRVLKPVKKFPAGSEQQLYDEVKKIEWDSYLSADDTLAVDAVVNESNLTHSLYVAQKTKDAIVDMLRDKTGKRPNVELHNPTLRIHIHIYENEAEVSFDSSGESLHKRGYRQQQVEAPLNETLAAAMIMLSDWDKKSAFTDLMCGSGTIAIEAAMMARNIPPGYLKGQFGFHRWKDFDAALWNKLLEEAKAGIKDKLDFHLVAIDKSYQAIDIAKQNAQVAGVLNDIDFYAMPFEDYTPKENEAGTIVTNPPYGGRITDEDLFTLYKEIGSALKKKFTGWNAWILTANREAANQIGLRASRKIALFNGPIECRLLKYQMYSGTKKMKTEEKP
jgi:putative N6-adenine-specific DNA methylase